MQESLPVRRLFQGVRATARRVIGAGDKSRFPLGRATRAGMVSSAVFLGVVALWMVWVSGSLLIASLALTILALVVLFFSLTKKLTLPQANLLALIGHLCALVSFYFLYTRLVNVTYVTDSIAGTYMGIVKVLQLQNPYSYSIKSVLDLLGFPPSLYTPRVDGSFEFHLNYPAMNFLALIPSYLAGLHDIRDGIFLFHLASVLTIFALVPPRLKALSLAPFALGFPFLIGYSWTDSVWAFFVLLTAVFWIRDKRLSLLSFGLAVATKQIALVAGPFLLIRLWNDTSGSKVGRILKGSGWVLTGFMVPNVPFITASPSAWWAAIIAPYLPSKTSLVPGGIGLAEILPDSGLGLSPIVLTAITGFASAVCIGVFLIRYRKLSRFLWAMPIIVLFFYPRSLPNYLVYWSFPYLFEWFKYGSPSLSMFRLHSLSTPSFKVSSKVILGALKRRAGPLIILTLILTVVIMGASGAHVSQVSRPRLEVKLDRMADPDSLGVATSITVTVINYGSESITPRFFVKWFFLWDLWRVNGTDVLPPSASGDYELTATDALAAVPRGSPFRIAVYDSASGEFLGLSKSYMSDLGRPKIANPEFRWWTLDLGTGRQAPFAWKPSFANIRQGEGAIGPAGINASSGVELLLNSTSRKSQGLLMLSQRLLFNETNLTAKLNVSTSINSPGNELFGVEATDHVHSLYYLLSPAYPERMVSSYGSNTTIMLPIHDSIWQSISFDIQSSWLSQGWNSPSTLDVSFFLRSPQPGWLSAQIQEVSF